VLKSHLPVHFAPLTNILFTGAISPVLGFRQRLAYGQIINT
jgi:hypothetical protein